MKNFSRYTSFAVIACSILFFLVSCKKQITEDLKSEENTSVPATSSNCKTVALGVLREQAGGVSGWETAMQKWYGSNGKPAFLKASLNFDDPFDGVPPILEWGEVLYNGNQVYVKNVPLNDTLIRVTLDDQQRPAASYFFYDKSPYPDLSDTSYYYFSGSRVDSILSMGASLFPTFPPLNEFRKFKYSYDAYGNLVLIEVFTSFNRDDHFSIYRVHLSYDYTQPVTGMLPSYIIHRPHRLLEYLDLLHFPIHHKLMSVGVEPHNMFSVHPNPQEYKDHGLLQNGLVYSYVNPQPFSKSTYYTGWDCGGATSTDPANRQSSIIRNLDQFKELYPASRK